jgi:hypothetical protein
MNNKITTTLETITPARAAKYLEHNTTNRRVRYQWRDMLAQAIDDGRWRLTHQGIAFNCDGTLIDGQHRLMAIVKANKPVQAYVTRGMDREALYAIDQGKGRSVVDVAGPLGLNKNISGRVVAVARAMVDGMSTTSERIAGRMARTNEQWIEFIMRHDEALQFAVSRITAQPHRHSVVTAAVARAWYTADRARLVEWCNVFQSNTGQSPSDNSALVFAKWFLPNAHTLANGPARRDTHCRVEWSLVAFLKRRNVMIIKPVTEEQFPIPGEED